MSENKNKYNLIIRYLKGLLSNRERHNLEKEMMRDSFDEESFEGLTTLSAYELEKDLDALTHRLDERIHTGRKRSLTLYYRIAAGLLLLTGIGSILYFVFRSPHQEFLSQDIPHQQQVQPAETSVPSVPAEKENKTAVREPEGKTGMKKTAVTERQGDKVTNREVEIVRTIPAENRPNKIEEEPARAPARVTSGRMSNDLSFRKSAAEGTGTNILTGRVVGVNGKAIAGVAIMEVGASYGTLTDYEGRFALQVEHTRSKLNLNSIGYNSVELNSNEIAGKDITLTEDLTALNEIAVVKFKDQNAAPGIPTGGKNAKNGANDTMLNKAVELKKESRSKASGAAVTPKTDAPEKTISEEVSGTWGIMKPLPPGGTFKAYRQWMDIQVNHALFSEFPGKYRMEMYMTVHTDGTLSDITVKETIPPVIAAEYKRIVSQSAAWKPAMENDTPVEAEIMIRFPVTVE